MAIFRGVGGSGSSSDNSFLQEVTAQAQAAEASATSAANSLATIQNTEVTSASFNTGDGVLTLTKLGGATVTADLDGRFLTSYTETNDLSSAVTWTNVPNAYITAGSVTQHQAALTITESQISDLQSYLTSYTETNDLSTAVTWANVPDANITESSVTQHLTATNVANAGALMDSEVTNLAQVKAFDSSDYATAAQGSTANSALQDLVDDTTPQLGGDLDLNGNDITGTGNISITQSSTSVPALTVYNTDTSDVASPTIRLDRKSPTTADDDSIGKIEFYGWKESVPPFFPTEEYANITGVVNDGTNSTIDGQLDFNLAKDNALTKVMSLSPTELTVPNVDISTVGSVITNIATGSDSASSQTKTVNIGTGYGGNTTNINIGASSATADSNVNIYGDIAVDGDINLSDSNKINLGASNDLQIYHDGSNSYIDEQGTGDLILKGLSHITMQRADTGVNMFRARPNRVQVYADGNVVTTTDGDGLSVTGDLDVTGTVDGKDLSTLERVYRCRFSKGSPTLSLHVLSTTLTQLGDTYSTKATTGSENNLNLSLQLTHSDTFDTNDAYYHVSVDAGSNETVITLGTLASVTTAGAYRQGYVSGDVTKHFSDFMGIARQSGGGSPINLNGFGWYYNASENRTYIYSYLYQGNNFATNDTLYLHPFDWESSGTTIQSPAYEIDATAYDGAVKSTHNKEHYLGYFKSSVDITLKGAEPSSNTDGNNVTINEISGSIVQVED